MAEKDTKSYYLWNMSRDVRTRVVRANNPTHGGMRQFIGGTHRLIRGRPLIVSEDVMLRHIEEIKQKNSMGMLEVKTPDGRLVDLQTLEPAPAAAIPPKPAPLQDSIANDDTWGMKMENVPAGIPQQDAEDTGFAAFVLLQAQLTVGYSEVASLALASACSMACQLNKEAVVASVSLLDALMSVRLPTGQAFG
jgi:hypothetical protein